jgi:hypothetical protein
MIGSSWSASRTTHVKIVVVSLSAATVVALVGAFGRVADPASGSARTLQTRQEVTPLVVAEHTSGPPAISCRPQAWPNVDRHCPSWTSPQSGAPVVAGDATVNPATRMPEVASVLPQADRDAGDPPAASKETAQPFESEAGRLSVLRVRKVERRTLESARVVHRGNDDLGDLPLRGFAGDTRNDVLRPTNVQDVYYYASRPLPSLSDSMPFSSLPGTQR